MERNQEEAIDKYSVEFFKRLENVLKPFQAHLQVSGVINTEELAVVNVEHTPKAQLFKLVQILKTKDNGWVAIINYLQYNDYARFAAKLKTAAGEPIYFAIPPARRLFFASYFCFNANFSSFKRKFKTKLIEYYTIEYSRVPTMFGCHKHVRDIWVPLKLEDRTGNLREQDSFNHMELLDRLKKSARLKVALVKGHPGAGKTTLMKKIAYDWADGKISQFSLILAVPLRYVGPTTDFLQLTADYYSRQFGLSPDENIQLLKWQKKLKANLLICLDGLDEYNSWVESPFQTLFAPPFERKTLNSRPSLPFFSYQVLVTSRPYACEHFNRDFHPLRCEISPLDISYLEMLVYCANYCGTKHGVRKVSKYLETHAKLVIRVPLILTFVCYLADVTEEVPSNLTLLYLTFLGHMIKREIEGKKLTEDINFDTWKNSKILRSTGKMAFIGCESEKFKFTPSVQADCAVTKDSFTCGLLLQNFDFSHNFNAEFPHRSIQEFLAAFYCYQLISTPDKTERNSVMKEILREGGQFGRFFFGICSDEKKFDKMLVWLNPALDDAEMNEITSFDPSQLFSMLSHSLADCTETEAKLLGQKLADSLDQLEKKIKTERNSKIFLVAKNRFYFLQSFQSGLNLNFFDEEKYSWTLSEIDKPRWSRLSYVIYDLPVCLREKFDKIHIFMWIPSYDWSETFCSLDRLPPVSTLIVQTGIANSEVNFDLDYDMTTATTTSSAATQLRHFTFGFDNIKPWFKDLLSEQPDTDGLIIGEMRKTGDHQEISWLTVRVSKSFDQSQLVRILMELSLTAIDGTPLAKGFL